MVLIHWLTVLWILKIMSYKIDRNTYAQTYGPTTGDRVWSRGLGDVYKRQGYQDYQLYRFQK